MKLQSGSVNTEAQGEHDGRTRTRALPSLPSEQQKGRFAEAITKDVMTILRLGEESVFKVIMIDVGDRGGRSSGNMHSGSERIRPSGDR